MPADGSAPLPTDQSIFLASLGKMRYLCPEPMNCGSGRGFFFFINLSRQQTT